jgi:hypothetical protein
MALAVGAKTGVAVSESQVHLHGWLSSVRHGGGAEDLDAEERDKPARACLIFIQIEVEALR